MPRAGGKVPQHVRERLAYKTECGTPQALVYSSLSDKVGSYFDRGTGGSENEEYEGLSGVERRARLSC